MSATYIYTFSRHSGCNRFRVMEKGESEVGSKVRFQTCTLRAPLLGCTCVRHACTLYWFSLDVLQPTVFSHLLAGKDNANVCSVGGIYCMQKQKNVVQYVVSYWCNWLCVQSLSQSCVFFFFLQIKKNVLDKCGITGYCQGCWGDNRKRIFIMFNHLVAFLHIMISNLDVVS